MRSDIFSRSVLSRSALFEQPLAYGNSPGSVVYVQRGHVSRLWLGPWLRWASPHWLARLGAYFEQKAARPLARGHGFLAEGEALV